MPDEADTDTTTTTPSVRYQVYLDFNPPGSSPPPTSTSSSSSSGTSTGSGTSSGSGSGSGESSWVPLIPVRRLTLQESYNAGWFGDAHLFARVTDSIDIAAMFGSVLASGAVPGRRVLARMVLSTDASSRLNGRVVRTWPCMVGAVIPYQGRDERSSAHSLVRLMDPITYLGNRPIWGAYRGEAISEIVGGALSLAAGGDGKPTRTPALPGMPQVTIAAACRKELQLIPYVFAVGQTLGEWLHDLLGMLGLRVEMHGSSATGKISVLLTDHAAMGSAINMNLLSSAVLRDGTATLEDGTVHMSGIAGYTGAPLRGGVLDDAELGSFRRFRALGAIGSLHTGAGIGLDEATRRGSFPRTGAKTESLMVSGLTRQPGLRPGRRLVLNKAYLGRTSWQIAGVGHTVNGGIYDNAAVLLPTGPNLVWHPQRPPARPPRYVSGVVDGGSDHLYLQPVERDRLGRIPVTFSFLPTPLLDEAMLLASSDTDRDSRLTMADFTQEQIDEFSDPDKKDEHEEMVTDYRAGTYNDPYPGKSDSQLNEKQLAERKRLRALRQKSLRYLAYKRAAAHDAADRDQDGYLTSRDTLVSDALAAELDDDAKAAALQKQWLSMKQGTFATDYPEYANDEARKALVREYGAIFDSNLAGSTSGSGSGSMSGSGSGSMSGSGSGSMSGSGSGSMSGSGSGSMSGSGSGSMSGSGSGSMSGSGSGSMSGSGSGSMSGSGSGSMSGSGSGSMSGSGSGSGSGAGSGSGTASGTGSASAVPVSAATYDFAREDASIAPQRWPPRMPLPVIQPMAGGLHGLVPIHRHGDVCRVAVHDPMWAEIVGFQYRANRRINENLVDATAGLIVEHDRRHAWTGIVFHRTEDLDESPPTSTSSSSGS